MQISYQQITDSMLILAHWFYHYSDLVHHYNEQDLLEWEGNQDP